MQTMNEERKINFRWPHGLMEKMLTFLYFFYLLFLCSFREVSMQPWVTWKRTTGGGICMILLKVTSPSCLIGMQINQQANQLFIICNEDGGIATQTLSKLAANSVDQQYSYGKKCDFVSFCVPYLSKHGHSWDACDDGIIQNSKSTLFKHGLHSGSSYAKVAAAAE